MLIIAPDTHHHTFFMMVGFQSSSESNHQASGGYSGIQKVDGGNMIIYSLWRSRDFAPKLVRMNTNWPGANVQQFGGEGTGLRFMAPFLWALDADITMQIEANRTATTATHQTWHISAYMIYEGEEYFLCTYEWTGTVALTHSTGFYSFIEDYYRVANHIGHDFPRSAYFYNQHTRPLQSEGDCNIEHTHFYVGTHGDEIHGADKVRQLDEGEYVFMETGQRPNAPLDPVKLNNPLSDLGLKSARI